MTTVLTRAVHWWRMWRRRGVAHLPFRLWLHWAITGTYPVIGRTRSAGERWGRWHWLRVFGLRVFCFPFWHTVNAVRRMRMALRYDVNLVTNEELWKLTEALDDHPDDWEHACMCAECRSCG